MAAIVQVQRYQAGESGHGGIEHRALVQAGFSAEESNSVYFGNWLRDFSQLTSHPQLMPLLNILALGEFNHPISQADLGTYVPSEHLDNPAGGGTVEDPTLSPAQRQAQLAALSSSQRTAYDEEERNSAEIQRAAGASHLPAYIERGKSHSKQKLAEAVRAGHNDNGMRAMGDGLHAVEDYFSHSNFTEVAIWTLQQEGANVQSLVASANQNSLPLQQAANLGHNGRPQIITGTYAGSANTAVSGVETLKTELQHGQLTTAFVRGWFRSHGLDPDATATVLGDAAGDVAGAVAATAGGVAGGVSGAAHGAAEGWEHNSGISAVTGAASGLFHGGASGAASGGASGWRGGQELGHHPLAALERNPRIRADMDAFISMLDTVAEQKTRESAQETAAIARQQEAAGNHEAATALQGPTHSQIAKDSPDNHLFSVSVRLAEHADTEIGSAMQRAWAAHGDPNAEESVTTLVDKFVSEPAHDPWWRSTVLAAARG